MFEAEIYSDYITMNSFIKELLSLEISEDTRRRLEHLEVLNGRMHRIEKLTKRYGPAALETATELNKQAIPRNDPRWVFAIDPDGMTEAKDLGLDMIFGLRLVMRG